MKWEICLFLSIFSFIAITSVGVIWSRRKKTWNIHSLISIFIVAMYFSLVFLFYPVCRESLGKEASGVESLALSFIKPLQVFVLNENYSALFEGVAKLASEGSFKYVICVYRIWGTITHFFAPILLAGFIVTLFQRIRDLLKLHTSGNKNIYLFSELNTKTLILARSCVDHEMKGSKKEPLIIFTSVQEQSEDESVDLVDQAREMGALCMKDDILDLNVKFEKKRGKIWFFIFGSDETKNTGYALSLIDRYESCENIRLYILSDTVDSELMIGSAMDEDTKMQIRRINSERSIVYSYLYDTEGNGLFEHLFESSDRVLSIVLVGLGKLGTEFLRALVWYGQMPEIRLQIHVFEKDPLAEEKFASLCPELMELNHNHIDGDCQYDIWFHHSTAGEGIDAETIDFDREIYGIPTITTAFVTLGDDAKNIRVAVKMRSLFKQRGMHPVIHAAVYDSERNEQKRWHDFQNDYDIDFIGNAQTTWSYDNIVMFELEKAAKVCNFHWKGIANNEQRLKDINKFYQDEYNRKSSMAGAIRAKVRNDLADPRLALLPGANKSADNLTDEEQLKIEFWEHIGWNAYMRSEGYRWAIWPETRDKIAKSHSLLVPFDELPKFQATNKSDQADQTDQTQKDLITLKDIEDCEHQWDQLFDDNDDLKNTEDFDAIWEQFFGHSYEQND